MSLLDFGTIMKFLTGEPSEDEREKLFKETAFMVLARATSADTNIKTVELVAVREVLKEITGEDVSEADLRTAAKSYAFERQPLEKYLSKVGGKLHRSQRIAIVRALARIIKSDDRISSMEISYVDTALGALGATPSEIIGLMPAD